MKNKILSITVEQRIDDCPDTSFLGKYTNNANPWKIDRGTGRFVISETKRDDLIEQLEERIYEKEDNNPAFSKVNIERTEKRIEKLKNCLDQSPIGRGEYQYFQPYAGGEKPGTLYYKKYAFQDYQRMESLNRGDWCFIGIMAKATVQTENGVTQHITSGGLWGIESDSGDYIKEVVKEQLSSLKCELLSFGFSERAIHYAMKKWDGEIIEK
jgi:hypothetical protein